MQKTKELLVKLFFNVGERLAIIVLLSLGMVVFLVQKPQAAFSVSPILPTTKAESMLVYPTNLIPSVAPSNTTSPTSTPNPLPTETPTLTPTSTPTPAPAAPVQTVDANSDAIWDSIADCESNGNWSIDTGNGYFGGLQFSQGAWDSVGGTGNPAHASRDEQIAKGKLLQSLRGWGVWGACAAKLGLD